MSNGTLCMMHDAWCMMEQYLQLLGYSNFCLKTLKHRAWQGSFNVKCSLIERYFSQHWFCPFKNDNFTGLPIFCLGACFKKFLTSNHGYLGLLSGGASSSRLQMRGAHKHRGASKASTASPHSPGSAGGATSEALSEANTAATPSSTTHTPTSTNQSKSINKQPATPSLGETLTSLTSPVTSGHEKAVSKAAVDGEHHKKGVRDDKKSKWSVASSKAESSKAARSAAAAEMHKQKTEMKMTTRPRRDSSSSLAAAMQVKAQKDNISGELTPHRDRDTRDRSESSASSGSKVRSSVASVRIDRDKETEIEAKKLAKLERHLEVTTTSSSSSGE